MSGRVTALAQIPRRIAAHVGPAVARLGSGVLDVAFPPACLVCRRSVGSGEPGLCGSCWRALRLIERPYCDRLCIPFAQDFGPDLVSPEALARPPVYGRARAVARFEDGPARVLVHALKYGDRLDLAGPLGGWMARAGADVLAGADLVVPVPLHRVRLWRRRFNRPPPWRSPCRGDPASPGTRSCCAA